MCGHYDDKYILSMFILAQLQVKKRGFFCKLTFSRGISMSWCVMVQIDRIDELFTPITSSASARTITPRNLDEET